MAEILCGAEPAAAAAAAGAASEVVPACEPPIVRARKRRMEYARRYGSSSGSGRGGGAIGEDQQRKNRREADRSRMSLARVALERERARDKELERGGGGRDGVEEDEVLLRGLQLLPPGSIPQGDSRPPPAPPRYGMASVRGRRRDMEDAVSIRPCFLTPRGSTEDDHSGGGRKVLFHFFGVFDGHGCSHVALSCKDRLHELISEELMLQLKGEGNMPPLPTSSWDWDGVMERAFARMDKEVVLAGKRPAELNCGCELLEAPKCDHVGSTAVVALVTDDRVVVANCGDSRAVMCRNGVPVPLSEDHKPDRPDELQRIQMAGGRVIYWDGARVLGVLAMSRAIGDSHLKPYVTSKPEVTVTPRTESDEFLVLATDGLWDVVSNATACHVVRMCLRRNRFNTMTAASLAGLSASVPTPVGRPDGGCIDWNEDGEDGPEGRTRNSDRQAGSDRACLEAAVILSRLALARGSADNVSVVVVDLRNKNR